MEQGRNHPHFYNPPTKKEITLQILHRISFDLHTVYDGSNKLNFKFSIDTVGVNYPKGLLGGLTDFRMTSSDYDESFAVAELDDRCSTIVVGGQYTSANRIEVRPSIVEDILGHLSAALHCVGANPNGNVRIERWVVDGDWNEFEPPRSIISDKESSCTVAQVIETVVNRCAKPREFDTADRLTLYARLAPTYDDTRKFAIIHALKGRYSMERNEQ